jgi:uncharacterized protein
MTSSASKPLAVVTGASSGIGRALARQLSKDGFDLVVTAGDDRLDAAAAEVRAYGAHVRTVRADLRTTEGLEKVFAAITADRRPVEVAVLGAGAGRGGAFLDTELADEIDFVDVAITSTVSLAKWLLRDMTARDQGKVLITCSGATAVPGEFQAVHDASTSFLQSFAEALQRELGHTGVTVGALLPGQAGASATDDPAQLAAEGLRALLTADATPDVKVTGGSPGPRSRGAATGVRPQKLRLAAHRRLADAGSAALR